MKIDIHGEGLGGRAVGRPRTLVAGGRGDPATLGGLARLAMLSRAWRHTPPVGDDIARAFYFLRTRVPAAAALLPRASIAALTRPVPLGGCSWCTARFLAAASLGAWGEPEDDGLHRAFLGSKCGRCRVAFEAAEVAEREREHTDQLVAAGFRPVAAGRLRTDAEVAAYRRDLESLANAKLPPRATGAIWPAGKEPPGLVAAARAAARRTPATSSYRPGRPR